MRILNSGRKLPFRFATISRWWGKVTKKDEQGNTVTTSEEIDLIATDAKRENFILGECKFTNQPIDLNCLTSLQSKLSLQGTIYYYLFSLSGFTQSVKDAAASANNIFLITPADILSVQP
jgi:hypothetical protein